MKGVSHVADVQPVYWPDSRSATSYTTDITPNDVPMDGTIAMFPLQDFSKIIAKQWTPNGLIQTLEYLPANAKDDNPTVTLDEVMSHMDERLDQIEDLFTKPNQAMNKGDNNAKSA